MEDHPNPKRGCGTKDNDACYAEGSEFSADGMLQPWVWLLGDGINENLYLEVPPRQVIMINPVATITLQSLIGLEWPYEIPEELQPLYERLNQATKSLGIADHVGATAYSAFSFAAEVLDYGPSRRISKDMARELAEIVFNSGPIPMLFTHNRMPVFRHAEDRLNARMLIEDCMDKLDWNRHDYLKPTWLHDNWGMYRNNWVGNEHYMLPILTGLSIIDHGWKEVKNSKPWQRLKDFLGNADHVRFMEQPFGMSWLCKITYTLDENGQADPEMLDVPGINILDLDAIEELDETLEEANEQVESAPLGAD